MLSRRQRFLLLAPFFLLVILFTIWPALYGLFTSLTNYVPFQKISVHFVGLSNYIHLLADRDFRKALGNILMFTFFTVSIELLLGVLAAYRLRKAFRGRNVIRFILLLPWLISPLANGVMWRFLLGLSHGIPSYGAGMLRLSDFPSLVGQGLALPTMIAVDIWRKMPLVMFLVLPGLQFIAPAYWDLVELEGMSLWVQLRHIVFPQIRLLVLTIMLLLIGDTLATAESILMVTGGGPGSETMTPGLYSYNHAVNIHDWIGATTSAWLIAAIVLVAGVIYLRLVRQEKV